MNYFGPDPLRLKEKRDFRLEAVYIGNIKLFCDNLLFLEKINLKPNHFDQKLQVWTKIH